MDNGKIKIEPQEGETEIETIMRYLGVKEERQVMFEDEMNIFDEEEIAKLPGYQAVPIDVCGKKVNTIMKDRYAGALADPSGDDSDILKGGYHEIGNYLGKKQVDIHSTMIGKRNLDMYVSSLIMMLVKYPSDMENEEVLKQMGIYDEGLSKLYAEASTTAFGVPITTASGSLSDNITNISFTGSSTKIKMTAHVCEKGSHYALEKSVDKIQKQVNIQIPKLQESYTKLENTIVEYIEKNATESVVTNARNLVRMYLNMKQGYKAGKALPIIP